MNRFINRSVSDYVFIELTNMTKFYEVSKVLAASSFLFAGAVMGRDTIAGWTNIIPTNA